MAFNGLISGVPVTIDNVKVGTAEISADGTCYIRFAREGMEYAALMTKLLTFGLANGISISANAIPAINAADRQTPN